MYMVLALGCDICMQPDLAAALENPFRQNWHGLPLDGICQAIQRNLLEIQSRHVTWNGGASSIAGAV